MNINNIINECCICLTNDSTYNLNLIKLKCCDQLIHKQCIFKIIINGHNLCPLCRRKIELKKYFTRVTFLKHIYNLPFNEKYKNIHNIQTNLYQLTFFEYIDNNNHNTDYIIYIFMRIINFIYICIISFFPYIFILFIFLSIFILLHITAMYENVDVYNNNSTKFINL
jgi:hypothetical protein